MAHKSQIPIDAKAPKRGDRVRARDLQKLQEQVKRLSRQGQEKYASAFYRAPDAPFLPRLRHKPEDSAIYQISVAKGYVIERVMVGDDALIYHKPTGIVDEFDAIVWHDITDGQCVYVQVAVETDGTITTDPLVLIEADDLAGEHYRPEVFDFAGNAGEHNYKICKFTIVDGKPKLTLFCAGDNIDHYDERVSMINMDAEGTVYEVGKDYDEATDKVRLRRLKQLGGEGVAVIKDQEDAVINFRRVKQRPSPAQIQVTESGDAILVQGNTAVGSLTHIPCGEETGTVLIEWDDGLITTNGAITFEAGCSTTGSGGGGGMP